jgi:hypothetical protein
MPRSYVFQTTSLVVVAALLLVPAAHAEDAPAAPAREVWEGFVWKDAEGRLQYGRGVVAMGVMAMAPWYVEGPVAAKLAPYVTPGGEEWLFWNYQLERPEPKTLEGLPPALLRLEGEVTDGENTSPGGFPPQAPRTMKARLAAIEFLDPAWLRDWAVFFQDPVSPFRVAQRPDPTPAQARAFADKALATLLAMRKRPGPSEAQMVEARAIDPAAQVVTRFREEKEAEIQTWLVAEAKTRGWTMPELAALPALPPSSTEIQGWFLESASKQAFLAKVKERWKGDLGRLTLVHYVSTPSSTTYATADLLELDAHWSEATFQQRRADTRAVTNRR